MNARPHHLTESQIQEFRKQAEELRNRRIITESNSFWSSLLLVVSKKSDVAGEKRWLLVLD